MGVKQSETQKAHKTIETKSRSSKKLESELAKWQLRNLTVEHCRPRFQHKSHDINSIAVPKDQTSRKKKKTRLKKSAEAEFSQELKKTIPQQDESVRSTEAQRTKQKREKEESRMERHALQTKS